MADAILVNKCDPPISTDARMTLFEYKSALKYRRPLYPNFHDPSPVMPVSAKSGDGIPQAWKAITGLHARLKVANLAYGHP